MAEPEGEYALLLNILLRAKKDGDKMWTAFQKSGCIRGNNYDAEAAALWVHDRIYRKLHPRALLHEVKEMVGHSD